MNTMSLVVSVLLVILPFIDWTATVILWRASRRVGAHAPLALLERTRVATILALITSTNAVLGVATLLSIQLDPSVIFLLLSASLLGVGIPNLYWLVLYYRNRLQ